MGRFAASLFPPDLSPPVPRLARSAAPPDAGGGRARERCSGLLVGALLTVPASATVMLAGQATLRAGAGRGDGIARRGATSVSRGVLAVLRGIPELLWVLLCIVAVGFGPFAGALALGLHTAGVLGKLWAEGLDEVPPGSGRGAGGGGGHAGWSRAPGRAWPQARGLVASYAVLRWEFNLRVSALVGFLGGGGLGLLLYNSLQLGFHERVCTLVLRHLRPGRASATRSRIGSARAFSRACGVACRVTLDTGSPGAWVAGLRPRDRARSSDIGGATVRPVGCPPRRAIASASAAARQERPSALTASCSKVSVRPAAVSVVPEACHAHGATHVPQGNGCRGRSAGARTSSTSPKRAPRCAS